MDYLHKPRRLLITGRSGTGKTEYYIRYLQSVEHRYSRLHVFDPECEVAIRSRHTPVCNAQQLERPEHWQCFDCSELYPGDLATALDFYADYSFECARSFQGQSMFCCDEMQKITGTDIVSHEVACIIETGRRWEIDTTFVTQQLNLIHNRIRNQQTEVVTFHQQDERAMSWLESFGFDADEIRQLDTGEYICRTYQGIEKRGNIFRQGLGQSTAARSAHPDVEQTGDSQDDCPDAGEPQSVVDDYSAEQ